LCGNVTLFDLDSELNAMGVTSIRYIDDVLMVSANEQSLTTAAQHCHAGLEKLGLSMYLPNDGSGKAARGACADGINFLGCTLQPNRCVPSAASVDKYKESIRKRLKESKDAIYNLAKTGGFFEHRLSLSETVVDVGRRAVGWQKSFQFCTGGQEFRNIDEFTFRAINEYREYIHRQVRNLSVKQKMLVYGIPSMGDMIERQRKS
jgi:hypothetical protein